MLVKATRRIVTVMGYGKGETYRIDPDGAAVEVPDVPFVHHMIASGDLIEVEP